MSRFRFDIPTEEQARDLLEWRRERSVYQAESYADAVVCTRRLMPVTSEQERAEVREYLEAQSRSKVEP